jgi:5-methylcytosine-specific restriction enzyme B
VEIARMLQTINRRLEVLVDRDHVIGHAYFCALAAEPTIEKLKEIFRLRVLPLLTEYFYADLGRIGLVLGDPFVERVRDGASFAHFQHEAASELAERAVFRLRSVASLTTAHFRAIYETEA